MQLAFVSVRISYASPLKFSFSHFYHTRLAHPGWWNGTRLGDSKRWGGPIRTSSAGIGRGLRWPLKFAELATVRRRRCVETDVKSIESEAGVSSPGVFALRPVQRGGCVCCGCSSAAEKVVESRDAAGSLGSNDSHPEGPGLVARAQRSESADGFRPAATSSCPPSDGWRPPAHPIRAASDDSPIGASISQLIELLRQAPIPTHDGSSCDRLPNTYPPYKTCRDTKEGRKYGKDAFMCGAFFSEWLCRVRPDSQAAQDEGIGLICFPVAPTGYQWNEKKQSNQRSRQNTAD